MSVAFRVLAPLAVVSVLGLMFCQEDAQNLSDFFVQFPVVM